MRLFPILVHCSTSVAPKLHCCISRFMTPHTVSMEDMSGLQAFTTKPHCWNTCRMWPGIVLLNVPFSVNDAYTGVKVTHATGTNTTPILSQALFLELCVWMFFFFSLLFSPEDMTSMIFKINFKCGFVRPQQTFPLCQSISEKLGPISTVSGC